MAKKKSKKKYYARKQMQVIEQRKSRSTIVLSEDDIILTCSHLAKLQTKDSTKDWIENRMYELRQSANQYERKCIDILKKLNIKFIHQAPFIVDGKIYFADFYFPETNLILEIDGISHVNKVDYDRERDYAFSSYKIKTTRISNAMVSTEKIKELVACMKIKEVV